MITIERNDLMAFAFALDDAARYHVQYELTLLQIKDRETLLLAIETLNRAVEDAKKSGEEKEVQKSNRSKKQA